MATRSEAPVLGRFPVSMHDTLQTALRTSIIMDENAARARSPQGHYAALTQLLVETDLDSVESESMGPINPIKLGILLPSNLRSPDGNGHIHIGKAVNEFTGEETISRETKAMGNASMSASVRVALEAVVTASAVSDNWGLVPPLMGLLLIKSKAEERRTNLSDQKLREAIELGLRTMPAFSPAEYWRGRMFGNEHTYGIFQYGRIVDAVKPHSDRILESLANDPNDINVAESVWTAIIGATFTQKITRDKRDGQNAIYKGPTVEALMMGDLQEAYDETINLADRFPEAFQPYHRELLHL